MQYCGPASKLRGVAGAQADDVSLGLLAERTSQDERMLQEALAATGDAYQTPADSKAKR